MESKLRRKKKNAKMRKQIDLIHCRELKSSETRAKRIRDAEKELGKRNEKRRVYGHRRGWRRRRMKKGEEKEGTGEGRREKLSGSMAKPR